MWGHLEGGPIRWAIYRVDGKIVGIVTPREELPWLSLIAGYVFFELLGEACLQRELPTTGWQLRKMMWRTAASPSLDVIVRCPSYLPRSSRKRKATRVEAS